MDCSEMKVLMSVTTEEAGAVIGKNGLGIEAIREMSRARVEVSKKKDDRGKRVLSGLKGKRKELLWPST